jgi:hypothetical protein
MYSGNMGRGHRFGEFLAAAAQLKGERAIHWVFSGGGARRGELEAAAARDPQLNLRLLPYAPFARLREQLCSADVHLVSLDAAWQGCMIPSKFQGIFAVGRPVILVSGRAEQPGPVDRGIGRRLGGAGGRCGGAGGRGDGGTRSSGARPARRRRAGVRRATLRHRAQSATPVRAHRELPGPAEPESVAMHGKGRDRSSVERGMPRLASIPRPGRHAPERRGMPRLYKRLTKMGIRSPNAPG